MEGRCGDWTQVLLFLQKLQEYTFYSLLPCFLIILYLYPVCYFISNRQPAVTTDDQPVAAFLDDLDSIPFLMSMFLIVSEKTAEHRTSIYGPGIACVCL